MLGSLAAVAGWTDHTVFGVGFSNRYPSLNAAVRALNSSGVAARAMAHAGEAAVSRARAEAPAAFLGPGGDVEIGVSYLVLLARSGAA